MEIAPGVYSMEQSKGGHVHAFLLDDGTDLTLIDTLFDTDAGRIIERIEAIGRSIEDLKYIVLTHAHRSHLGGLSTLKAMSGATVYAHAWEADIVAGERIAHSPSRWFRCAPCALTGASTTSSSARRWDAVNTRPAP